MLWTPRAWTATLIFLGTIIGAAACGAGEISGSSSRARGEGGGSSGGEVGGASGQATTGGAGVGGFDPTSSTAGGGSSDSGGGDGGGGESGGASGSAAAGSAGAGATDSGVLEPDAAMGGSGAAGGSGGSPPIGKVGNTWCLNSDGPAGMAAYPLIESVLGSGAVEHNPDNDHNPVFLHIHEDTDAEVGNHFVFYAHYPTDNDGSPTDDRSRIEIKVNTRAADDIKGKPGSIMTYTWRFKMDAGMKFSNRFTHMWQIKSEGGNSGAPIFTLTAEGTGSGENLHVDWWSESEQSTTLARAPMTGIKGVWLRVYAQVQVGDSGHLTMTIKKPDGSTVLSVDKGGLDAWRQGTYVRPKWGIYRGKAAGLNPEDHVRFANWAITGGPTPSSDCGATL
jgi:hypothetical protein